MRTFLITFSLVLVSSLSMEAQEFSSSDRQSFLEKLEKILIEAESKKNIRSQTALSAFRGAMNDSNAAFELYLKCEERVNFEEAGKKNGDFRDWKRRNAENFSKEGFRIALQLQLRWLVITLEAANEETNLDSLSVEAAKWMDYMAFKAKDLSAHKNILKQSVMHSVFARSYDLDQLKLENWPLAGIPMDLVYEKVIFPPLRRTNKIEALKSSWAKRIQYEGEILDEWSSNPDEKGKSYGRSSEFEKFVAETLPRLQWQANFDVFKVGNQQSSAIQVLKHIEENLSHPSAKEWAQEFLNLLKNPEGEKPSN